MGKKVLINIKDLFNRAFGGYKFPDELEENATLVPVLEPGQFTEADKLGDGNGLLGQPIYQRVVLVDGADELDLGDCLVDFVLPTNIVKTPVNGKDGTVKEFISHGDYQITIRGILVSENPYRMPEDKIRQFMAMVKKKKALAVESKVFDVFGVHNIVIENRDMPQLVGYFNLRPFTISCISDEPFELELTTDNAIT